MGLLAEKYHKLPSEIVGLDLRPITELMFNSMISARVDKWLAKRMKKEEREPVSVAEQVRREQAEWQKLK